jgi:2-C-methyl-D-erythritol 4-phosphate cytidylyltransferase
MKKYAVIVAGGSGVRMGSSVPKQFLLLQNKPVLWHTLHSFLHTYDDLTVILVVPAGQEATGQDIADDLGAGKRVIITTGGITRFHSVKNGLQHVKDEAVVFVHDGVRCLVSPALIERCYEQALKKGSAVPAVAATDSIRMIEGNTHRVADRNLVRIIQTPQTFRSSILLPAFAADHQDAFTDEATVVEASGTAVHLVEGEYENIKITRPADLLLAEKILQERNSAQ